MLKNTKFLKHASSVAYSVFRLALLIAIGYIVIYPVIYMISSSVKTTAAFADPSVIYIPKHITFEYYSLALEAIDYKDSIISTVKYEIVSAVIEILICSFIAYGLARFDFKEKKILMLFMFLLILVPSQMMMLPIVTTYTKLDLLGILGIIYDLTGIDLRANVLNTVWTFYLPALLGVGIRAGIIIYIYIQFFKGLPKELEEASWIDGAGPLKTYLRIALPSSGVVIMTVTVFSVIWHWNDYYLSQMYLYSDSWPLAVRLSEITSAEAIGTLRISFGPGNPESIAIVMAGCVLFVIPVLIMYMVLQRKFVKSIDRVGITG